MHSTEISKNEIVCLVGQVGELLGTLIKTFKASFLPFFDELASYLMPMWVSQPLYSLQLIFLFIRLFVGEEFS